MNIFKNSNLAAPSSPPPTYSNSISNDQITFCNQCGASCVGPTFCATCGAALNGKHQSYTSHVPLVGPSPLMNQPFESGVDIESNRGFYTAPVVSTEILSGQLTYPHPNGVGGTNGSQAIHGIGIRIGNRLIYDFEKVTCCVGESAGLDPLVKEEIPVELSSRGLSADIWSAWMIELEGIQKLSPSLIGCLFTFCFPGFIAQAIFCAMFCPISGNHCFSFLPCFYGDWYEALRQWMDNVNKTLNQYEMHAKLVTYKPYITAPRSKLYNQRVEGKDTNYEMSFLVIALTNQESDILRVESWDHGVNDYCTSGVGRCL